MRRSLSIEFQFRNHGSVVAQPDVGNLVNLADQPLAEKDVVEAQKPLHAAEGGAEAAAPLTESVPEPVAQGAVGVGRGHVVQIACDHRGAVGRVDDPSQLAGLFGPFAGIGEECAAGLSPGDAPIPGSLR